MDAFVIKNAHVVSPDVELPAACVFVESGKIIQVVEGSAEIPEGVDVFDAGGRMLVPGFVDIHTHGANGADMSNGTVDEVRKMAEAKAREGVTTFFPTSLTLPHDELLGIMEGVAGYQKSQDWAKAPKVHIEGPYINPDCTGAQNPAFVRDPDAEELLELDAIAPVGIVSVAIEMPNGVEFIGRMKEHGIVCSAAHTAAKFSDFVAAKDAGLQHLTHFCNQMTPLHHREIGMVGAGLIDDDIMIEMICDTIHLVPDMIRLVWKLKPVDQLMLITDSMSASWLPDGKYDLGGLEVFVKEGSARLENGALAGSTVRFYECFKNVLEVTGLPAKDVVKATSWNQARSLGLEGIGKIEQGFRADLALLHPETYQPDAVWVDGVRKF